MSRRPGPRARVRASGFTLLELLAVLTLIGLAAAAFGVRLDVWRYRMDGNARFVQNTLLGAQQIAVTQNVPVLLLFDASAHRIGLVRDLDGNRQMDATDPTVWKSLLDGGRFRDPPSTIDGALAVFATGPGMDAVTSAGLPRLVITPSGSIAPTAGQSTGDVIVYLGSPSGRASHARAVRVLGATVRSTAWSFASGAWRSLDR